jgi:hypothetical protein
MTRPNRLNELLLDCLRHLVPHQWPGGDGFTNEDVLHEYPTLAASRLVPGEDTLNRLHPELAAELAQFFAERTSQQGAETEGEVQPFVRPEQAEG